MYITSKIHHSESNAPLECQQTRIQNLICIIELKILVSRCVCWNSILKTQKISSSSTQEVKFNLTAASILARSTRFIEPQLRARGQDLILQAF